MNIHSHVCSCPIPQYWFQCIYKTRKGKNREIQRKTEKTENKTEKNRERYRGLSADIKNL